MGFKPQLIVFDLDGTLIDSRMDLTNSVNAMLRHFGKETLADEVVASYIGDGASALVRRSLGHAHLIADKPDPYDDAFIATALDWFIAYYKVHKLDHTYVYPGVVEALVAIRANTPGVPMAVLTNKPVDPSRAICRALGLEQFFFANYGGNSFQTKKPDPEGLLRLMAEAPGTEPVSPSRTVMVGDSHVDVETARAAGARAVGCLYGLSPESLRSAMPDILVERPAEWPQAILALGASSETRS